MSDGTMYRPFTWQYPDPANTLSGLCPDCQGVGFESKLTPLAGTPQHDFEVITERSRALGEMIVRPASAYADNELELDPPTGEDLAARRKWADRHVAVLSASPSLSARATAPQETLHFQGDPNTVQWWGTGGNLDLSQSTTERKLNLKLDDPPPPYHNPLAALRRERKVKSGKAAKLLGISRQRLHVVEHSSKSLPCMNRLLAKAAVVWPVGDETTVTKGGDDARK
jgi:hypothetical protein